VQQYWKDLGDYGTLGLEVALSVVVGLVFGHWLDGKFGTAPWLGLVGLGFGVAAGVRAVYRALARANRQAAEEEQREREQRKRFHDRDEQE
jgi:ATP synthase protein I